MLAHQRPGIRQALESSGVEMQVLDTATPAQQKVDARSLPHFDTTGHLSQGHAMDTERREDEEADDGGGEGGEERADEFVVQQLERGAL